MDDMQQISIDNNTQCAARSLYPLFLEQLLFPDMYFCIKPTFQPENLMDKC